jgi:MoaA/NifB/PqqE/SkfB family radical SAM enzyme
MLEQIRSALTPIGTLAGPIQLILFITDRCNARCHHCFNWQAVNYGDDGLRLDELRALSSDLGSLLTLSISGGEPSLRADLAEAITIFTGGNSVGDISIPTNGLLPDALCTQVRHLLDQQGAGTLAVSLSLDGLEQLQDEIRGVPGSFRRIVETCQALVRLREETHAARLLIKVGTVISNRNAREIPALIEWVRREMPGVDFHNFEILRGNPRDKVFCPPSVADLEWLEPKIFAAWQHYAIRFGSIARSSGAKSSSFLATQAIQALWLTREATPPSAS